MRTRRDVSLACLAVVLSVCLLGIGGCSTSSTGSDEAEQTTDSSAQADEEAVENSADESGIGDWFEGRWIVDASLITVSPDADWAHMAADQPSAEWESRVDGSEMMIDTGLHLYSGTLVADGDDWNYDGMATYLDEEGVEWTSHIVVDGVREGDEAFSAEQWGEIASDTEGTLYVATWDLIGTRVPE